MGLKRGYSFFLIIRIKTNRFSFFIPLPLAMLAVFFEAITLLGYLVYGVLKIFKHKSIQRKIHIYPPKGIAFEAKVIRELSALPGILLQEMRKLGSFTLVSITDENTRIELKLF